MREFRVAGYDHHAIFDRWATAPEAYVIHHPVGKKANPPDPELSCVVPKGMYRQGSLWFIGAEAARSDTARSARRI